MNWKKIKKLSFGTLLLLAIAWVWIPTGTPDDLITTLPLINYFGFETFLIITILLIWLVSMNKEIRSVIGW